MDAKRFRESTRHEIPPEGISVPLSALWWDAKGDWETAHHLVDELETREGMAVHAYLHRKQGASSNADYWYERAGRGYYREELDAEWDVLVKALLRKE